MGSRYWGRSGAILVLPIGLQPPDVLQISLYNMNNMYDVLYMLYKGIFQMLQYIM